MATSSYSNVLVHLRNSSKGTYELAKFSECILDYLGIPNDGFVECILENNRLMLQAPTLPNPGDIENINKSPFYKIMHPPFCPIHHLSEEDINSLPPDINNRGVDVGVAVLLESSDKQLLLTRRAPHMRTFPGVWVPPGGHIEVGETLEDAALRELHEETGLFITTTEKRSSSILGLWESVYPPVLAMGEPKRHHIVVYLHITLDHPAKDIIPKFKLCPEEVDAAVWLTEDLVRIGVWEPNRTVEDPPDMVCDSNSDEIHITLVNQDGEHASGTLDANILRNRVPLPGIDLERISTGSRFALNLWLEKQSTGESDKIPHHDLYKAFRSSDNIQSSQSHLKHKI